MKYMGSKRTMLKNGLGQLLIWQVQTAERFVDLFTGAGSIAWYIAENTDKPVLAIDLQKYATTLAEAIIGRTNILSSINLRKVWIQKAIGSRDKSLFWHEARLLEKDGVEIGQWVEKSRELCAKPLEIGPIWSAYGGHYFSPSQAITFDFLLAQLPEQEPDRVVCMAACISAVMECVASPGHTAQPFQPTESAGPFIYEAWKRDPIAYCQKALDMICPRHAQVIGNTITGDALDNVKELNDHDLVFIDPPYSSVQYSRFYHVLETIARGQQQISVFGVGRYPSILERPQSKFSSISQSKKALEELLEAIASRGCKIIFTFPDCETSNGLSGEYVKLTASEWFHVEDHSTINGQFSTLGGNNLRRDARKKSSEIILLMEPKKLQSRLN